MGGDESVRELCAVRISTGLGRWVHPGVNTVIGGGGGGRDSGGGGGGLLAA
jgi:hypothetical protein